MRPRRKVVSTTLTVLFISVVAFAQLHAQTLTPGSVPSPNSTPTLVASPSPEPNTQSYARSLLNADISAARTSGHSLTLTTFQYGNFLQFAKNSLDSWSRFCDIHVSVIAEKVNRAARVKENAAGGVEVTRLNDGGTMVTLTRLSVFEDWTHKPEALEWCQNQERIASEEALKIIQAEKDKETKLDRELVYEEEAQADHAQEIQEMLLYLSDLCDVDVKTVAKQVHAISQALDEAAEEKGKEPSRFVRFAVLIYLGDNPKEVKNCNLPEGAVVSTPTRKPTATVTATQTATPLPSATPTSTATPTPLPTATITPWPTRTTYDIAHGLLVRDHLSIMQAQRWKSEYEEEEEDRTLEIMDALLYLESFCNIPVRAIEDFVSDQASAVEYAYGYAPLFQDEHGVWATMFVRHYLLQELVKNPRVVPGCSRTGGENSSA